MATRKKATSSKRSTKGRVGSDTDSAKHFADANDFGIPAADAGDRMSASEEAKSQPAASHMRDPRQALSSDDENRTSGVGGVNAGVGSSSGGDVDTDVVGLGGSGLSASGPEKRETGPDMHSEGSHKLTGKQNSGVVRPEDMKLKGNTVNHSGGDVSTTGAGQGSGSTSSAVDNGDDASAGEISQGEAGGDDNE